MDTKTLPYWIINSLLENDLYKFNMNDVICRKFNDYTTVWTFKCRNADVKFTPEMVAEIRQQIDHYCTLRFAEDEIQWLSKNLPWLSKGYVNHLVDWTPKRKEILINEGNIQAYNDCGLAIEAHGTWLNTSMYEIAILAIVNEVYFAFKYGVGAKDTEFQKRTIEKFGKLFDRTTYEKIADSVPGHLRDSAVYAEDPVELTELPDNKYEDEHPYRIGNFAEFGLRRRLSAAMQDWLIKYCVDQKVPGFVGTSNVYLAKKYGCKATGTQAHEFYMAYQGNPKLAKEYSNYYAMKDWIDAFQTRNGTALTDTLGTDLFLRDFDLTYANLFSGVRHDSGDPIEWGDKLIAHYKKLDIDPTTKTLLFSDSLNFEKATAIKKYFDGKVKIAFGIGTYLACDVDVEPLNIVMKMTECNGYPVAKLSNTPSKGMCKDEAYVDYLQRCIDWRLRHEQA